MNHAARSLLWPTMAAFALTFAGCGKESDKVGSFTGQQNGATHDTSSSGLQIYSNDAALPVCDASLEGHIAYISSTKSMRACAGGKWDVIDLKGDKGDKGEAGGIGANGANGSPGPNAELAEAIRLYQDYRKSVYRVTLRCNKQANAQPADVCADKQAQTTLLGTSFLCGATDICTNEHVVICPQCYVLDRMEFQSVEGDTDSVNSDGTPAAPFLTMTTTTSIKRHASLDLAKVPVGNATLPAGAKPLVLATDPSATTLTPLQSVLSISYPLGFQDLYVDLGSVNTRTIGECDRQGGAAGYGCPGEDYDFSTSNDTDHGSSGSPLLDIKTGKVIGVTTAGTEGENANFTWAVDASHFKEVN